MKIKAEHHAVVLASLFTLALIFSAGPVCAQLSQLTAIPFGQPAIGEEYTYLARGLFVYSKIDLSLPGPGAINVTRVYRSRDKTAGVPVNNRAFGLGTRLNYDMFLHYVGLNSNGQYEIDVEMPDSSALACTSTTNTYPFTCNNQPAGEWFNSYVDSNSDVVRQDGTTYHFDINSSWLLVSIKDHYSNLITITRGTNTNGQCANAPTEYVSEVASSNGRYVCFSYGDSNNPYDVTEISDNAGIKKVDYTYGSNSQLQTVTQTNFNANAVTTYHYNQSTPSDVQDITEIDVNTECSNWGSCSTPGSVPTFVYYQTAANGAILLQSISSQVPGNGYQYNYTFDSSNTYVTKVAVTLPDGSVRKFQYDQAGYVTLDQRNPNQSTVNEEDTVFTRGSQPVGNSREFIGVVQEEDGNANTWRESQYFYDSTSGDVLNVTLLPSPGQNDNNCSLTSPCFGGNATWNYTYEPAGMGCNGQPGTSFNRLCSAVEPMANGGVGTTYSYNNSPTSPSVTITDPLSRSTIITGNAQGRPVSIQDPLSNTTQIGYDGTGNLNTVKDPVGNTTTYTPDADGRIKQVSSPLGRTTAYAYDALDDVTSVTVDPPTSSHTGLNLVTSYAYDLVGQVRSITTPNNNTTTITRNAVLTKTTVTEPPPLSYTTVTNLDRQGRKTDFTDQRGLETTYKYDLFGRVTKTVFNATTPSGSPQQETVTFGGFDALDRPTSVTDSLAGTLSDTYDSLDSILSENDNLVPTSSVTYGYDPNGRRISMQGTLGSTALPTVNYGYDCDDELIGITVTGSGYSNPPNCSPSTQVTNGTTSTQVGIYYDLDGMPNWIQSDGIRTTFITRDADERVTNQGFTVFASGSFYGNLIYTYNADGNLTNKTGSLAAVNVPPAASATYDVNDQIATWNPGTAAGVDAASNITTDPASGINVLWTARNQVQETVGSVVNGYDANGRRAFAAKTNDTDNLGFLHDGGAVAGWVDSYTGDLWNFLEIGGLPLAGSYTMSGTTTNWVPLIDASGSTIGLVNPASPGPPASSTYTYDPSGSPTASGSSSNWPFLYHGMEHEFFEPNQYYYAGDGAYYSSQIMRSLSLTDAQGTRGLGAGPDRKHHHGHGGGGGGSRGAAINGHVNAAAIAEDGEAPSGGGGGEITIPQAGQTWFQEFANFWEDLGNFLSGGAFGGGGGQSLPPNYYLLQYRLGEYKKHQVFDVIIGANVIVDQGPLTPTPQEIERAMPGDQLFRVYGGKSPQLSKSFTTQDPRTMVRPRDELGLPNGNTGERMVTGRLKGPPEGLPVKPATPLNGNSGGAPEVQVPNAQENIEIEGDVPFDMPPDTIFLIE